VVISNIADAMSIAVTRYDVWDNQTGGDGVRMCNPYAEAVAGMGHLRDCKQKASVRLGCNHHPGEMPGLGGGQHDGDAR
jgi:hypothetical protein